MCTHNTSIPFLNIKKKIFLNYPKSATMGFVPRDSRMSFKQPLPYFIIPNLQLWDLFQGTQE